MILHGKIKVSNRRIFTQMYSDVFCEKCQCHNVEFKTVDKHRLDEKDLRYFEIRVKGVPKRYNKRWNKWWWHTDVMKARAFVHIRGKKTMYFILCINKCHNNPLLCEINIVSVIANYCHKWSAINMTGM